MHKYPRTPHIQGSRFQPGDEELQDTPIEELYDQYIVIEEKCDGANSGISFSTEGELLLQSRGHYLTGGGREKHFNLFKSWATAHQNTLWEILRDRYIMYGEWIYAKHTVFYDNLPNYFIEFDILDTQNGEFLSTELRRMMLDSSPITSAPVLWEGVASSRVQLSSLLTMSHYKSSQWKESLAEAAAQENLDLERVWKETDPSDHMEGLYIKVEKNGAVEARYKYVRASFLTSVVDSGTHWLHRPILPNRLQKNVNIFGY